MTASPSTGPGNEQTAAVGPSDADVDAVRRFLAFLHDHDCMVAHVSVVVDRRSIPVEQQDVHTVEHWIASERGETE